LEIFSRIAEAKITEAMKDGEFDDLPGRGQPLRLDDLSSIPGELRAAYIILKNAGILPEELQLQKEIVSLQKMLDHSCDDENCGALRRKITEKVLRFNLLMEKRKANSAAWRKYEDKLYGRIGR
jgi:transcription elongation factor GreA-like protein